MPTYRAPRKSGLHRIAAIALYRALLSQCKTAAVADEQRRILCNTVRTKFKKNANVSSIRLLTNAFKAGHEALDHLHSSNSGNQGTTSYIHDILSRFPKRFTTEPQPFSANRDNPKPKPPVLASGWENTLLSRRPLPLSFLKGEKRRIPVLVSANRIPILRTTKPQPLALTMYLRAKLIQRQRRHDRRWELNDQLGLAKWEDEWDKVINQQLARRGSDTAANTEGISRSGSGYVKEPTWEREVHKSLKANGAWLDHESAKNKAWAARMVKIIDDEKELAEKERKERNMAKNLQRRERKIKARDDAKAEIQR